MITYIYTLDCPITGIPKYVGKTINKNRRLASHLRTKENTKKWAWIVNLKNKGLKPIFTIIDEVENNWEFWENWYIDYYRFLGFNLKNHKGGGIGGRLSAETREKISKKLTGIKRSDEFKIKLSVISKGRIPANKGIPMGKEEWEKRGFNRKGTIPHNKGVAVSEEMKLRIKKTFADKYGWVKKEKKFGDINEYNKYRLKYIIGTDKNNNIIHSIPLRDSKKYGFNASNIVNCIKGKKKNAYGFTWKYNE